MSDLRPKGKTITLNDREYHLRCTLGVIDELQDRFDVPISEIGSVFSDGSKVIKNLIIMLSVMINEDIDIRRDGGEKIENVTDRFVARHLDVSQAAAMQEAMMDAMYSSIGGKSGEDSAPNTQSGQ